MEQNRASKTRRKTRLWLRVLINCGIICLSAVSTLSEKETSRDNKNNSNNSFYARRQRKLMKLLKSGKSKVELHAIRVRVEMCQVEFTSKS